MCKGVHSALINSCPPGPLKICPLIGIFQLDRNALLMEDGLLISKETLKSQEQNDLKATEICSFPTGSRFCAYLSNGLKCLIVWLKTYLPENASEMLEGGEPFPLLSPSHSACESPVVSH